MFRVNLVTDNTVLAENLNRNSKKTEKLRLSISSKPLDHPETDSYIVPPDIFLNSETMERLTRRSIVIGYGSPGFLDAAFSSGCDDYLKEPWAYSELYTRVMRFNNRFTFQTGSSTITLQGLRLYAQGTHLPLTPHETQILKILLKHRGTPVPRNAFRYLATCGGEKSRSLDMHISSLRKKIARLTEVKKEAIPIITLRGWGYLFEDTHIVGKIVDNSVYNSRMTF
ncbi:MAG: response regulator transcription factor [Spirochaetales bacterium]|nr:response regulator transcription factor [Spirochaetales bacterium]